MRLSRVSVLFLVVLLIGACASSARVIPKSDGDFVSIGTSSSESGAYDAALDEAKDECKKIKKNFAMVQQHSKYQGMDKNAKGVLNTVGMLTGHYGAGSSTDDHKVEITFKCR